ncbi:MAG TPA: cysteine desulfurase [Geminicoccaceae bacterium]|jgi:cysteine desulfurase/selenocysteine lyase|nr:cysteine desulfurase [Geminicoccaceae bacterium]
MTEAAVLINADGRFDPARARRDFPCLDQTVHGRPLVYFDSATSAQKPQIVIDALAGVLRHDYANIHRGVHTLSERATDLHEGAREKVRAFINAADRREVVFTRSGTEGINLVAQSYVRPRARPGDEVLITTMEHHANIVPWQLLREQIGLKLVVAPINDEGELLFDALGDLISDRTRLVSVPWVSNALGTINPVHDIVALAHARGVPVLLDACQAVQHIPVDVGELDCDFLVFSGHKVYGPSGIGVLYGKAELLEAMPPYQGGGDMILSVRFERTEFNELPYKFEAGTPAIEAAVGLGAALDYLGHLGIDRVAAHEAELLADATRTLQQIPGLRIVGTARHKCSVISFVMDELHPHDVGTLLDLDGIAVRTGHHCAMPLLERLGVTATTRASIALYNTRDDVEALATSLRRIASMF